MNNIIMLNIQFPDFDLNMLGWIGLSAFVSYFVLNIVIGFFKKDMR